MSAEAPKNTGINAPVTPRETQGCLPRFLRRLFGTVSEQTVLGIIQPPPVSEGSVGVGTAEQNTGIYSVMQPSQQPIAPDLGKPLDVALEVNAFVDKLILTEQEARQKQEEEKNRQEKVSRLEEQEAARREAEKRVSILAHNERSREIADISGVREFFSQAQLSLVRLHPSAVIVEGWGISDGAEPGFLKTLPDERYLNYCIMLAWEPFTHHTNTINIVEDKYSWIGVECGRDRKWNYYYPDGMGERVIIHMSNARTTIPGKTLKYGGEWQDDNIDIFGRVFKEGEWQNSEEIKRAVIEGIKYPHHHSAPKHYKYEPPRRPDFPTIGG
ncbi:MAG: hypothetical protein Q7R49_00075 [Candidatus Daviesbacteria bacterium]|nr:hypothetical protein [Candidatus Daviesbacteria bacterium]